MIDESENSELLFITKPILKIQKNTTLELSICQTNNLNITQTASIISILYSYNIMELNFIMNCRLIFPNIIYSLLYLNVIDFCNDTQLACIVRYRGNYFKLILYFISLSALIFSLQIYFYRLYRLFSIKFTIITILNFLFLWFYDDGKNENHHGGITRIILILLIIIFLCFIKFIEFLVRLFIARKFTIFNTIISIIAIIAVSFYLKLDYAFSISCNNWNKGLKNTTINNTLTDCKIYTPKRCSMEVFSGYFDLSYLFNINCETTNRNNLYSVLQPYITLKNKNAKYIGYPRTENWIHYYLPYQLNYLKH